MLDACYRSPLRRASHQIKRVKATEIIRHSLAPNNTIEPWGPLGLKVISRGL